MEIIRLPIRKFNLFNNKFMIKAGEQYRCFVNNYSSRCYRYITSSNGETIKKECLLDKKRSSGFCMIRTLLYQNYVGKSRNLFVWIENK